MVGIKMIVDDERLKVLGQRPKQERLHLSYHARNRTQEAVCVSVAQQYRLFVSSAHDEKMEQPTDSCSGGSLGEHDVT